MSFSRNILNVGRGGNMLGGIIPTIVTPLTFGKVLDIEGLQRLSEHLSAGGIRGIFAMGTTGEGPSLSQKLRHRVIAEVCNHVRERVPVLVGVACPQFLYQGL